jgi:hypothetical protein
MNTTHTTALIGALPGSAIPHCMAKPSQAAGWKRPLAEFQQAAKIKDGVNIPGAKNP